MAMTFINLHFTLYNDMIQATLVMTLWCMLYKLLRNNVTGAMAINLQFTLYNHMIQATLVMMLWYMLYKLPQKQCHWCHGNDASTTYSLLL